MLLSCYTVSYAICIFHSSTYLYFAKLMSNNIPNINNEFPLNGERSRYLHDELLLIDNVLALDLYLFISKAVSIQEKLQ